METLKYSVSGNLWGKDTTIEVDIDPAKGQTLMRPVTLTRHPNVAGISGNIEVVLRVPQDPLPQGYRLPWKR